MGINAKDFIVTDRPSKSGVYTYVDPAGETRTVLVKLRDLSNAPEGAWTRVCELPDEVDLSVDEASGTGYRPVTVADIGKPVYAGQSAFGPFELGELVHIVDDQRVRLPYLVKVTRGGDDAGHAEAEEDGDDAFKSPFEAQALTGTMLVGSYAVCRIPVTANDPVPTAETAVPVRELVKKKALEDVELPAVVAAKKAANWSVNCILTRISYTGDGSPQYHCQLGDDIKVFDEVELVEEPTDGTEIEFDERAFKARCGKRYGVTDCECEACKANEIFRGMGKNVQISGF